MFHVKPPVELRVVPCQPQSLEDMPDIDDFTDDTSQKRGVLQAKVFVTEGSEARVDKILSRLSVLRLVGIATIQRDQ